MKEDKFCEEWYYTALKSIGDAVIVTNFKGEIIFINEVAENLTKWNKKDALGQQLSVVFKIVNEITRKKVTLPLAKILKEGKKIGLANHTALINKKGEYLSIEDSGAPVKDEKGKIIGAVVVFHDASEKRKAEFALQKSEKKFHDIALSSADWLWEVDEKGKYTYVSEKVKEVLGYSAEEIIGKTPFDLMVKEDVKEKKQVFTRIMQKKKDIVDFENWNLSKDGKRVCLLTNGVPLLNEKGAVLGYRGVDKDITLSKTIEEELAKYKFVVEQSSQEIAFADFRGGIIFVNEAWAKNHGYTKKELIGKNLSMFHVAEDLAEIQKFNKKLLKKGQHSGEIRHQRKDGSIYLSLMNNFVLKVGNKPVFMVGMAADISDNKIAEELLKSSEKKYRTLVDAANDIIMFIDKKGVILEVNKKLTNISGYKHEEVVGKRISVLRHIIPKESMVIILKNLTKRFMGKDPGVYVVKIKTKQGELRDFEISAQTIKEKGKIIGDLAILRDVTDRVTAERKIIKSQEELKIVVENIADGVMVLDVDYNIIIFNKEAENISGFTTSEVVGKKFDKNLKFVYEGTVKSSCNFIKDCYKDGKVKQFSNHAELIMKDKERVAIGNSVSPLKDKDGKVTGCVVVFRDVSQEREIDKMKTEFVSIASHQLRTPLSGIKWISELLLRDKAGKLNSKQEEYVRDIYMSNNRLINLVGDLLDVSHIETGKKFNVIKRRNSVCKIIKEIVKDKKNRIKQKKIKLIINCGENKDCLIVSVDSKKIKQVFANLLDNAIKFTPDKGKIELGCELNNEEVVFYIKDNGIGIVKRQQQRVFEKFFRADNASVIDTEGSGLGLYIAKAIVEAHQGEIWFESKEGKGSTFYFSIPLNNKINKK